ADELGRGAVAPVDGVEEAGGLVRGRSVAGREGERQRLRADAGVGVRAEAVAAGQAGDGRALGGGGRRPLGPGPPVPRPGRRADAGRGQAGGGGAMSCRRRRRPRHIWGNTGPTPGASTRAGGPFPLLVLVGPVACNSLSAIGARAVVWLSDDRELQRALANQPRDRIGSDA